MTDPLLKHIKTILEISELDFKDISEDYVLRDDKLYSRVGWKLKLLLPHGARWYVYAKLIRTRQVTLHWRRRQKRKEKISADYWLSKMKRFKKKKCYLLHNEFWNSSTRFT